MECFLYEIGTPHHLSKPESSDCPVPPSRLFYEVVKSMYLMRKDYDRRFSIVGNEGRKVAESFCMLIFGQLGDPESFNDSLGGMFWKLPRHVKEMCANDGRLTWDCLPGDFPKVHFSASSSQMLHDLDLLRTF